MKEEKKTNSFPAEKFLKNLADTNLLYQKSIKDYLVNLKPKMSDNMDFFSLSKPFLDAMHTYWSDPNKAINNHMELAKNYLKLCNNVTQRFLGAEIDQAYKPETKDGRFKDDAWEKNPLFDFIKQAYFLNSSWIRDIVKEVGSLNPNDNKKLEFYTKLLIDAMAPTNFLYTNPEVLKETLASNGANLLKGAENLYKDIQNSKGTFKISTTDFSAFEVGKNLAITPGKIVYQNSLMQLIQYEPLTKEVYKTPIVITTAWINKYYILDLQEKNSFVRWLLEQGYTVFVVSWINPSKELGHKSFEDYMIEGPIAAAEQVEKITGEKEIHFIGYCLGGTLLAATIAYLKAKKVEPFPIKMATFLTVLVDFEEAGDLGVFIDEDQIKALEKRMSEDGYLDGSEMAQTFSMIRANDMIWSFYVNNYLLGKDPFPFDILYWNADSTRLPAKMHSFYLRNMYQKNLLVKPGDITLKSVPIDLRKIDIPVYMLATKEDHIVPWQSSYKATQVYKGPVRFVLSGSGHVAGVVNHPSKNKYNYWSNDSIEKNSDAWLKNSKDNPGSWWVDWDKWASKLSGKKIPARQIKESSSKKLADAPGDYVKMKI
jgi:polyhydroxyalkanoate synthase